MGLPPQERERLFTQEEVSHLVAREVAQQRMHDLERTIGEVKSDHMKMWAKFDASFDALQKTIERRDSVIMQEMEKDYATKLDLQRIEGKFNTLTVRLSTIVATIMFIGTVANYLITAGKALH